MSGNKKKTANRKPPVKREKVRVEINLDEVAAKKKKQESKASYKPKPKRDVTIIVEKSVNQYVAGDSFVISDYDLSRDRMLSGLIRQGMLRIVEG